MIILYDATAVPWHANYGPSINSVEPAGYKSYTIKGGVVVLNDAALEMAGGLLSSDYPNPGPGYFGLDVDWEETEEDLPHVGRRENDFESHLPRRPAGEWELPMERDKQNVGSGPHRDRMGTHELLECPICGFKHFSDTPSERWQDVGSDWAGTERRELHPSIAVLEPSYD